MNATPTLIHLTAQTFVTGLWQGLALTAAVALCLRVLPRLTAPARFVIWTFVFALIIALPFLNFGPPASPSAPSAALHLAPSWAYAIFALWAALSTFRAIQLLQQALRLRRLWQRAQPLPSSPLQVSNRSAQLCTSPDVDSPAVIGFFSPRLLLPEALLNTLTPTQLHHIALHEGEHLRRRDDWLNLLQKLALVLFPLNPALLWVDRRLGLERELACDAGVLRSTARPLDYAHSLTRLAEHRLHVRRIALALSAFSRQSELARRVHTLLRPTRTLSRPQATATLAVLTLALTAGSLELARAPHLISFTNPTAPVAQTAQTAASTITPRAIPVTFRPTTSQPHATYLKATLPPAATQHLRTARTPRHTQQQRLYFTDAPHPHHVYAIQTTFSPTYAALPFGDGWLIIQL